jgi:hypothetical protein
VKKAILFSTFDISLSKIAEHVGEQYWEVMRMPMQIDAASELAVDLFKDYKTRYDIFIGVASANHLAYLLEPLLTSLNIDSIWSINLEPSNNAEADVCTKYACYKISSISRIRKVLINIGEPPNPGKTALSDVVYAGVKPTFLLPAQLRDIQKYFGLSEEELSRRYIGQALPTSPEEVNEAVGRRTKNVLITGMPPAVVNALIKAGKTVWLLDSLFFRDLRRAPSYAVEKGAYTYLEYAKTYLVYLGVKRFVFTYA